jgi:uncharacterized protein
MNQANTFAPALAVDVNGGRLNADVSAYTLSASIVTELRMLDTCELTLANPYPAMRWTHTPDEELFREGNALQVHMGYVGYAPLLFDGEITRITADFPESGSPTVRIGAHSRMHRLQRAPKRRTFSDVTDKEIAQQIAADADLRADVEEHPQTRTRHLYVIQDNLTDLAFLIDRSRRVGFEVLVRGSTLVLRSLPASQPRAHQLVWGRSLRSFSPTLNTLGQVGSVVVRGYDPRTKREIVGRAGAGDEQETMGGSQTGARIAADAFGAAQEEVRVDLPVASQEEADHLARALYNERAQNLVTGTGSCVGSPDVRAGRVIELLGLGPRFSGRYYVRQATHTLTDAGYETTFSIARSAIP